MEKDYNLHKGIIGVLCDQQGSRGVHFLRYNHRTGLSCLDMRFIPGIAQKGNFPGSGLVSVEASLIFTFGSPTTRPPT